MINSRLLSSNLSTPSQLSAEDTASYFSGKAEAMGRKPPDSHHSPDTPPSFAPAQGQPFTCHSSPTPLDSRRTSPHPPTVSSLFLLHHHFPPSPGLFWPAYAQGLKAPSREKSLEKILPHLLPCLPHFSAPIYSKNFQKKKSVFAVSKFTSLIVSGLPKIMIFTVYCFIQENNNFSFVKSNGQSLVLRSISHHWLYLSLIDICFR